MFKMLERGWGRLLLAGALCIPLPALTPYQRSLETYTVPDVVLVDQDGAPVHLRSLLQSDRPVLLEFVFTTCSTICPVLSASFTNLQNRVGPSVRLVSISIDPENDAPRVLKDYQARFRAKPGWTFLTGTHADIDQVTRAFSAYVKNKMDHYPLILIRQPGDGKWVRLIGFTSSTELWNEYQKAGSKP